MSVCIPNELSSKFNTLEGRRKLIALYADSDTMFTGTNEHGETVYVSIAQSGIIVKTEQENGWLRVNYYDGDGWHAGETFEGRWRNQAE